MELGVWKAESGGSEEGGGAGRLPSGVGEGCGWVGSGGGGECVGGVWLLCMFRAGSHGTRVAVGRQGG